MDNVKLAFSIFAIVVIAAIIYLLVDYYKHTSSHESYTHASVGADTDADAHNSGGQEAADDTATIVLFYSDSCGHCKAMKDDWDTMKRNLPSNVGVAEINASDEEIISQEDIDGYPTIRLYIKATGEKIEYEGDRSAASLLRFVETRGRED